MTINEAIKRTRKVLGTVNDYGLISFDDNDAIKLGIEALKRIQDIRLPGITWDMSKPLPGETEN